MNDYKFDFGEEIKLNSDEFISKEDMDNSKKEIMDKFREYEQGVAEIKKELAKIKIKSK